MGAGSGGRPGGRPDEAIPDLVSDILDVVETIPPGRVMTYGDVAAYVGRGGPRQVGSAMARWGGAVPWWRVLRADGSPPPGHERRALEHYRAEGTPLRADGVRVDLGRARWVPITRPRHQITETDEPAAAPDEAAARTLEALARHDGALTGLYPPGHLEELREDWPE